MATLCKRIEIICRNNGRCITTDAGVNTRELIGLFGIKPVLPIMGVRVNNELHDLTYCIYNNKTIEFIDRTDHDGERIYVNTLVMILYKAINDVVENGTLRVEHSISNGYFCEIASNGQIIGNETLEAVKIRMHDIIEAATPITGHYEPTKEVEDMFKRIGRTDTARLLHNKKEYYTYYYDIAGLADIYPGCLLPDAGMINGFALNPYLDGFLLQPDDKNGKIPELRIHRKMYGVYKDDWGWAHQIGLRNICDLSIAKHDNISQLIWVTEALHEKRIVKIADQIVKDPRIKVILIAGPSSSGKTTFSKRLSVQLAASGLLPVTLSMDNYFVNRDATPLDEDGKTDFESIYALDIPLFCDNLQRLINGEMVETPVYNFTTGMREESGIKMQIKPGQVIVIEGIHGLNPELTASIPDEAKFKIYASALTTISMDDHNRIPTTDNRLLRRIIRDYKYRSYSAENTILRWPSVRRGEDKWIFPFQENADAFFNSALPYELAAIKKQAEPLLTEVPESSDAYPTAHRLLKMLKVIPPISFNDIPPTSLLREFLGGSGFKY